MPKLSKIFGGKKPLPKEQETIQEDRDEIAGPDQLKLVSDVVACVVDYGTFICLADKLGETYKKVYYYTPTSKEFYCISDLMKATGLENVERIEDIFAPEIMDEIDLFIFPDIGYEGLQKHLRSIGKAVWGSMGADELETLRTHFIDTLKNLNLPIIHTEIVEGLSELREHLKDVKNKWVKINKYRGNMETWHHIDYDHSGPELDRLAAEFGGLQESVTFVVQDYIKTDVEIGYDGWCVDGKFPTSSFQGYEKKNELYLGSLLSVDKFPKEVKLVNEALAPLLKEFQYRNFIATEIRVKDGVPYFIDPTMRMPGQTGEQLLETCSNLAEVIWNGANGEVIEPEFAYKFATSATIHYTAGGEWGMLRVPKKIKKWVKPVHFCIIDQAYHFPPKSHEDMGVIIGTGNTIEEAIEKIKEVAESLKSEPVNFEMSGFVELLRNIKEAEKYGIEFTTQKIPKPSSVVE